MSILTREEILKKLNNKEIVIEPLNEKDIGPASIDMHLDKNFRVFRGVRDIYHVDKNSDFRDVTKAIEIEDFILLQPGQMVHGITVEKLTLPNNIAAFIEGRSSIGRLGLTAHITAGFIQPGVSNKQVLEIHNVGPIPLALHVGVAICQVIFTTVVGKATYQGKYANQLNP
jgi:dCTP deaminase